MTGATGLILTSAATGTTIAGTSNLTATPALGLSSVVDGAAANAGSPGTTVLAMSGGPGLTGADPLTAGGSIVITNSSVDTPATPVTFVVGGNILNDGINNTYYTGVGAETVNGLVGILNAGAGALAAGLSSAVLSGPDGNIVLTSNTVGTTIQATSNVVDPQAMNNGAVTPGKAQNLIGSTSQNASFTMSALVAPDLNSDPLSTNGDALTGTIILSNGNPGTNLTITMDNGVASVGANTINLSTANSNLTGLMNVINGSGGPAGSAALTTALGISAALTPAILGEPDDVGLTFSTAIAGTVIGVNTTNLFDASGMNFTNPVSGGPAQHASGTLALDDGGMIVGGGGVYTGNVVVTNGLVTDTFVMNSVAANQYSLTGSTINIASTSLGALIADINTEGSGATLGGAGDGSLGLSAVADASTGGIYIQSTALGVTGLTATTSLSAAMTEVATQGSQGAAVVPSDVGASVVIGTGATNLASDVVSGKLIIADSGGTNIATTFTMGATANNPLAPDGTGLGTVNVAVNGDTLQDLENAVNADSTGAYAGVLGVDLSATVGGSGLTLTARDTVGPLSVLTAGPSTLVDRYGTAELTPNPGTPATGATYASAVLGTSGVIGGSDALSGAIVLNNGGADYTFTMDSTSANTVGNNIHTTGYSLANLATAITDSGIGLTAHAVNGALQLQSTNIATTISVVGSPTLQDTATETFTPGSPDPGVLEAKSTAQVNLAGALSTAQNTDVLTGSITLTGTNGTEVFTMGGSSSAGTIAVGSSSSNETLQNLAASITNSGIGITAAPDATGLALTMNSYGNTPITGTSGLSDTMGNGASYTTLGSFASQTDTLSAGTISFSVGGNPETELVTRGEKVSTLISDITAASASLGVTAQWVPTGNNGYGNVVLTSNEYGTAGNITSASSNVADTTAGVAIEILARAQQALKKVCGFDEIAAIVFTAKGYGGAGASIHEMGEMAMITRRAL